MILRGGHREEIDRPTALELEYHRESHGIVDVIAHVSVENQFDRFCLDGCQDRGG